MNCWQDRNFNRCEPVVCALCMGS